MKEPELLAERPPESDDYMIVGVDSVDPVTGKRRPMMYYTIPRQRAA